MYVHIPEIEKEKELNVRLNKNTGEFDLDLLAQFDESFLQDVGFNSEELDDIFPAEDNPEVFDLKKELEKLNIDEITVQKGDVYELDGSRLMCGDSTVEEDMLKLLGGQQADMCLTDPPYILDYLKGKKKHGEATEGFGYKRDRKYLETDVLPPDFTEKWMGNVAKISKPDFSIICYENWKNLRVIWSEMEKHWKVKNMIVWHLPNRHQGYSAKNKFFNKHDSSSLQATLEMFVMFPTTLRRRNNRYRTNLKQHCLRPVVNLTGKRMRKEKRIAPQILLSSWPPTKNIQGKG